MLSIFTIQILNLKPNSGRRSRGFMLLRFLSIRVMTFVTSDFWTSKRKKKKKKVEHTGFTYILLPLNKQLLSLIHYLSIIFLILCWYFLLLFKQSSRGGLVRLFARFFSFSRSRFTPMVDRIPLGHYKYKQDSLPLTPSYYQLASFIPRLASHWQHRLLRDRIENRLFISQQKITFVYNLNKHNMFDFFNQNANQCTVLATGLPVLLGVNKIVFLFFFLLVG